MGLRDHQEDGTGHMLSLGMDLDYLHVEGAELQAGLSTAKSAGNVVVHIVAAPPSNSSNSITNTSGSFSANSSYSSSSSCSTFSDSEDERPQIGSISESQGLDQDPQCHHDEESSSSCQTVRLDLANGSSGDPSQVETSSHTESTTDCRTKVDFALKLGYSEELVTLVLRKLGPDALINDILGELVKLGTKSEMGQQRGGGGGGSPTPCSSIPTSVTCSSSCPSLDPCRLLCPSQLLEDNENLRPIVVDGSNVAMSHGNKEVFSCQGIQLAVDWFLERGHRNITVFVPAWRKEQSRPDALITDQEILRRLEKEKILVFTPSRRVQGRRVVCYDDRFIVKLACESDGVIVSNDNYRDLANEKPEWKKFIDERLLMYSFVNDKFMPPDDPLGRHGPSLDNFLRKRPIIPEHRKQPCPYGKKCTYGHKCKFYHPERGNQPQRAVADELRASAKISSVASKGQQGNSMVVKCQSYVKPEGMAETEASWGTPKKQPKPSPCRSFMDLLEDRPQVLSMCETQKGNNSVSSCSKSLLGYPAPGAPPLSGGLDRWEHPGGSGGGSIRPAGALERSQTETSHRCESPLLGYSSLVKAYSSLNLFFPESPECFSLADLRTRSLPSDCSSEGSISSESFSPDPMLDDRPKCYHHHYQHHHPKPAHHCSSQYGQSASHSPPGLGQPAHPGYSLSKSNLRKHRFNVEDYPSSHAPLHPFEPPSTHVQPYLHHPLQSREVQSSFPEEYAALPQPQTSIAHAQSYFLGHNVTGSLCQDSGVQESRMYGGLPLYSRRNHPGLRPPPQPQWGLHYQQTSEPCYDHFAIHSHSDIHEKAWHSPWDRPAHSSPQHITASSLPSPVQPHRPYITTYKNHTSFVPQPSSMNQFKDLREKVFINLCGIFPEDLVRVVMTRNPHMMDAQELAAAILMEKLQASS